MAQIDQTCKHDVTRQHLHSSRWNFNKTLLYEEAPDKSTLVSWLPGTLAAGRRLVIACSAGAISSFVELLRLKDTQAMITHPTAATLAHTVPRVAASTSAITAIVTTAPIANISAENHEEKDRGASR